MTGLTLMLGEERLPTTWVYLATKVAFCFVYLITLCCLRYIFIKKKEAILENNQNYANEKLDFDTLVHSESLLVIKHSEYLLVIKI